MATSTTRPAFADGWYSQWPCHRCVPSSWIVHAQETNVRRGQGAPPQVAKPEDSTVLTLDDNRTRRKNTPGDQSMRRSIQDLVSSIDPNVKIEPEVEDVRLLSLHSRRANWSPYDTHIAAVGHRR